MPDRILREAQLTSESLNGVSEEAQILFNRLTLVVDDHGRFDARPAVIRARCFPLMLTGWPNERVSKALGELGAADMVCVYEADGRPYLHFVNWRKWQRIRAVDSKWPSPDDTCGHPLTSVRSREHPHASVARASTSLIASDSASASEGGGGVGEGDRFDEFWDAYPRKVGKPKAREAFLRALRRSAFDAIFSGAERLRDDPNRTDEFTPHPTTWLNRDGWNDDPLPARNGSVRLADRLALSAMEGGDDDRPGSEGSRSAATRGLPGA